ncbi:beta-ketoacyl synthase N-terminal-like domain-containing protein [Chitinophaga sp. Cy-1792]|uniref:beta-ketoacyl synthase N-terminal-like domain-containing protein n=1 Tax=Chitinophaga sp. Cy-1792 TaxID=2608339 RepID=UPI00141F83B8|nr:beta-ketoacyl synthase N-terminal-like domain-containing protein [Chitinophaga sp. Cy-1792]NIG57193.1 beta-ketoacyl synthase [Chitinophaga sp. Cy-1792]
MQKVFVAADNIVSPLGCTTLQNFEAVLQGNSGIRLHEDAAYANAPFYAAMMAPGQLESYAGKYNLQGYTKFETLLITSIANALEQTAIPVQDKRTGLIVSTTKGNIELLEQTVNQEMVNGQEDLHARFPDMPVDFMELGSSAEKVAAYFGVVNKPVVVSSACISGLVAIITAKRLMSAGVYDQVIVTGADVFTRFVLSGFQSFQAVSALPCKPFDANRTGVTLGEGAATVILTKDPALARDIVLGNGAVSNDANHISGPSRTGEELAAAMKLALAGSGLEAGEIAFVSAHGTATPYNDEMEAKALHHAGLAERPVNSLKGYYGHTLGAAGLIEAVISMEALKKGVVLPTKNFETSGVTMPVHISNAIAHTDARHLLKTVSGFGGCNAAMVFSLIS